MRTDCQRCGEPASWVVNGGIACDDCRADYMGRFDKTVDFSTWTSLYPTPLKKGDPTCCRCKNRNPIVTGMGGRPMCIPCVADEIEQVAGVRPAKATIDEAIGKAVKQLRGRSLQATPVDTRIPSLNPTHDTPKCTCGADSVPHEGHAKHCETLKKRD